MTVSGGAGLPGVTMSGLPDSPVTQADGSYTDIVNYGWSGTVTPTLAGYVFTPTSTTYTSVAADRTDDYIAVPGVHPLRIGDGLKRGGHPGCDPGRPAGEPGDAGDGSYTATVSAGWSGTATPTLTGYTFAPPSNTYANVATSLASNYTGALQQFTISGTVTDSSGAALANVVMNGLPDSPVTQSDGTYTATVSYGWSGLVVPYLVGYALAPLSNTYTSVAANQTSSYTATQQFWISGSVTDSIGDAIAGVTMSGLPGNPTTQADGTYTATVNIGWSGTVTPTLAGYAFAPLSKTYTSVAASQTDDYTGTLAVHDSGDGDGLERERRRGRGDERPAGQPGDAIRWLVHGHGEHGLVRDGHANSRGLHLRAPFDHLRQRAGG